MALVQLTLNPSLMICVIVTESSLLYNLAAISNFTVSLFAIKIFYKCTFQMYHTVKLN